METLLLSRLQARRLVYDFLTSSLATMTSSLLFATPQALMTLTNVFLGWPKVAAVAYAALALLLAYQYLRWVRVQYDAIN